MLRGAVTRSRPHTASLHSKGCWLPRGCCSHRKLRPAVDSLLPLAHRILALLMLFWCPLLSGWHHCGDPAQAVGPIPSSMGYYRLAGTSGRARRCETNVMQSQAKYLSGGTCHLRGFLQQPRMA